MLVQGQVKGQSWLFSPYRLPSPDQRQLQALGLRKCDWKDDEDAM